MQKSRPNQRRLATPGRPDNQQHSCFGLLKRRSQQLSKLIGLALPAAEHPMLIEVERAQPRKGAPIVRPAKTPGGINPAQCI
jgi:hypothetical protein